MSTTQSTRPKASVGSRRAGYLIAAVVNLALLYLINVWPSWHALSFITDDMYQVLGLVNLSVVASLVVNVTYVAHDARWWKALGDLATTVIGLFAIGRMWQVFPFDFSGWSFDWTFLIQPALIVGIVGGSIGVLVQLVMFVRALSRPCSDAR